MNLVSVCIESRTGALKQSKKMHLSTSPSQVPYFGYDPDRKGDYICKRGKMMNRNYDAIMQLIGADEFKLLIQKWDRLSSNIKRNPPEKPVLLPNLLWIGKSGIGRTKLMSLMSEYLFSKGNLMDFYGDVRFFEFLLGYIPRGQPFTELQRLEDELDIAAGFRNEFRGAILVDIDQWVDHYEEMYFSSFMEYLSAHSDKWMIVLSVSNPSKEKLQN